ncbi:hypothetical protein AB0O47_40040 [Streptomyces noursei]|uniref:hypothetical protein n=1 Tax=Streptomyces noursei TaxID=1971 RepID=UPI00344E15FA
MNWRTLGVEELKAALEIGAECGCNPRSSRKGHALGIASAMAEGDWEPGIPDIVCLCEHGGICNGRHRCIASVEAGLPLTGWVAEDVPVNVIRYADIGLKRTPADALAGRGVKSYRTALGATVRLLRLYDTQRDQHWSLWRQTRFTAPKIGDLYDKHYSDLETTVDRGRQIESGTQCCPSAAAAFAYLLRREGGVERLADISYKLAGGTGDLNDIFAHARTRLAREAKHRGRKADQNRAPYELGLLLTAVMAREAGKTRFSFGDNAPMPTLAFTRPFVPEERVPEQASRAKVRVADAAVQEQLHAEPV